MSRSSSKSSLDSGRRLPPLPEIGGSGGTVIDEPLVGTAGRAPAGVDGGTGGGVIEAEGAAPTSRSPVADGAAAVAEVAPTGERCGRPGVKAPAPTPADEVPAGTWATPASLRLLGRPPSKPAAMTVTRTSSPRASSITAPKMMLASEWAASDTSE